MKALTVAIFVTFNLTLCLAGEGAMEEAGIVPDVIDKVPPGVLDVTYPDGLKVESGNTLTPTKVKDPPTVKWIADEGSFYFLVFVDPDAPSRKEPKFREWNHWMVGNIPSSNLAGGDVLAEYIGSGPPEGTDLHRYVFLVYKQPGKLEFEEERLNNRSGKNRGKFSIRKFAQKYKLGDPIAGNFYQAQYDDYVPTLMKQLGGK